MTIWIDADSCPKPVKDIVARAAVKRKIRTVFVANKELRLPDSPLIESILVEQTADSADREIVERSEIGDLVITRDIPLASHIVEKGVAAIDDRGNEFTPNNIRERLSMRNFMRGLREGGVYAERTRPSSGKDSAQFANAFDRTITRLRISHDDT